MKRIKRKKGPWGIFWLIIFIGLIFTGVYFEVTTNFIGKLLLSKLDSNNVNPHETPPDKDSTTKSTTKEPIENSLIIKQTPMDLTGFKAQPIGDTLPSALGLGYEIIYNNKKLQSYQRKDKIQFGHSDEYTSLKGITTFRGNNYRNTASYGFADIREKKLEKVWDIGIGYLETWTGVGWTGQASVVQWSDELRNMMNINPGKKEKKDLKEVIYAALDGKIHFLDLEDGEKTRNPIQVGNSHKGSVSIDPRGYPLLYAGQGIPTSSGRIGLGIYSLIDQKRLFYINGMDTYAKRKWGAFDPAPLIHGATDTMIEPGENGILYSIKLNTKFDKARRTVSLQPQITRYRHFTDEKRREGIENSIAAFKNYVYFVDNGGYLQCVDINTLEPIWVRDVMDDTDSTIAIEESPSDKKAYLYTANEIDRQGQGGKSYIRKFDAMTGELIWERGYRCAYDSKTNGGALASPVVGKHQIQDLVIYNLAKTNDTNRGKLVALDKKDGKEVWTLDLKNYSWSSPVDVYDPLGRAYIIVCDSIGNMYLVDGSTGIILDQISLETNIEASPVVYEDMLVVGTRGQKIFGIRIR